MPRLLSAADGAKKIIQLAKWSIAQGFTIVKAGRTLLVMTLFPSSA
jgi:hypothetical protein